MALSNQPQKGNFLHLESLEFFQGTRIYSEQDALNLSRAQKKWLHNQCEIVSYFASLRKLTPFLEILIQYPVIEIGPGNAPITNYTVCADYMGASPLEKPSPTRARADGLSYLLDQEDNAAVVVSFGVIEPDILGGSHDGASRWYGKRISQEIRRVAHPFALIIGGKADQIMGPADIKIGSDSGGIYYTSQ